MQEQEQLAQLNRMRRIATGLLALMAVIFVGARLLQPAYGYFSYISAFAEAAMVGALADWFAVTALFRRPLGLPIPHTAIIPNNKDRIGETVASFLQHNFMTHEVLSEELEHIDFAGATASWLAHPENSRAVARQIVSGIPAILRMVEDDDVGRFMQDRVASALQNMKFAPFLGEVMAILVAGGQHQLLFDRVINILGNALEQNHPYIRQKIHEKSPRWIPKVIDDKFFERLLEALQSILDEMRREDSEWRYRFQQATEEWIEKLRTSPEYELKIVSAIGDSLGHPLFLSYTDHVWHDVKTRLLADATADDSQMVAKLEQALRAFSEALLRETAIRDKLNQWMRAFAANAIYDHREAIASLVARVIRKWDAETVSRKFEIHVGKDLQYIRINGTLVGGMVGLLLHIISLSL